MYMDSLLTTIICIIALMNLKWLMIALVLPFQVAEKKRAKVKKLTGHKNIILYALATPYVILERLMRGGWERYMLFQVGVIPSLHVRKWFYQCLGTQIGKNVVFHFKTEVRAPENLIVGETVRKL